VKNKPVNIIIQQYVQKEKKKRKNCYNFFDFFIKNPYSKAHIIRQNRAICHKNTPTNG
jgi:hypothetical protein